MLSSGSGSGVTAHGEGGGDGGFFSTITGSVADTFKEVLPVWTKQELINQQGDQLKDSTFNRDAAPRTLFQGNTSSVQQSRPQVRGVLGDITANIDPVTALGVVALVFGGVFLIKKVA